MKKFEDIYLDSVIMTNHIMEDAEIREIIADFLNGKITEGQYGYKMMELALNRGREIIRLKENERLRESIKLIYESTH